MLTRKSGILALVVGALVLGACENKAPNVTINEPTPPISITISPNPVPQLKKGQTVQLVAAVQNSTNTAVTWSVTSGSSVVTVSSTGLVTATNPGTATVQAVSAADANVKAAVAISVADTTTTTTPPATPGQPTISISSVNQSCAGQFLCVPSPVNPGNVAGLVDVTLNVDIPAGVTAKSVVVTLDNQTTICTQTFGSGTGSADASVEASQVPQLITCTLNTAALNADSSAQFLNGTHTLKATVLGGANGTTALATATYQPLLFNNTDVVLAVLSTERGPVAATNGLTWRGGAVTVHLVPTIYSVGGNAGTSGVQSMAVSLVSSNNYITGACNTLLSPAAAGCGAGTTSTKNATKDAAGLGYTAVFPYATIFGAGGAGGIEDPNVQVVLGNTVTNGGNNFLGNFNPVYTGGVAIVSFDTNGDGQPDNPLRLDNMAPRVTNLNITPAALGCTQAACYVNGSFTFASSTANGGTGITTVDYGVDSQTNAFDVLSGSTVIAAGATNASGLAETQVAGTYALRVTSTDKLANDTVVFAGATATSPIGVASTSSATPGTSQLFGVDKTNPYISSITGAPANNGTDNNDADVVATIAFADTATAPGGPAGFGATPLTATVKLYNAANQAGTTLAISPVCGAATCTVTIPDAVVNGGTAAANMNGYIEITASVKDASFGATRNTSPVTTRFYLDDEDAPSVAGVTAASTIVGGQPATFSADMSDNVELGDNMASVGYGAAAPFTYYAHQARKVMATYGLPLTTSAAAGDANAQYTFTPFIYSLEPTNVGGAPSGAPQIAQALNFAVRDMAGMQLNTTCAAPGAEVTTEGPTGNCQTRENNNISVNVLAGNPTINNWATTNAALQLFMQNAITRTGAAAPFTVTLQAEARGPQGTFANPFDFVNFYWNDPAANGRWVIVPGTVTVQAIDDDVQLVRRWVYTLVTNTTVVPIGATVRAIGVKTGQGLIADPDRIVP